MAIIIRNAIAEDIEQIMRVEQSWDESGRASADVMLHRIKMYPQGFFVAMDESTNEMLATICAMPAVYSQEWVAGLRDWSEATNAGKYYALSGDENALYIVSGVIDKAYRGGDIFSPMVERVVESARSNGFSYVFAGAVLPGYKRYTEKHGSIEAEDYVALSRGSSLLDPLLAMYQKVGFHVPNKEHIKSSYFPDDASLNHAALVVKAI